MRRTALAFFAAVALLAAAALPAVASTDYGRLVPVSQELKDFFAARGVDPQYLGMDQAQVPADQWARIVKVVTAYDDPDVMTDDHDRLNTLVMSALIDATSELDSPVYITLGNSVWIHQQVSDD